MGLLRTLLRIFFPSRRRRRKSNIFDIRQHQNELYRPIERPVRNQTANYSPPRSSAGPNAVIAGITLVETIRGQCYVVDGDTITIGQTNIRLAGVDAPEIDQPYGKKAKWALFNLCNGHEISAEFADHFSYERHVATCYLPDGRDLSAEMVKLGLALDWRKFSGGKYRHLEPEGVRRRLWRVDAKHKGQMPPSNINC